MKDKQSRIVGLAQLHVISWDLWLSLFIYNGSMCSLKVSR